MNSEDLAIPNKYVRRMDKIQNLLKKIKRKAGEVRKGKEGIGRKEKKEKERKGREKGREKEGKRKGKRRERERRGEGISFRRIRK